MMFSPLNTGDTGWGVEVGCPSAVGVRLGRGLAIVGTKELVLCDASVGGLPDGVGVGK
jgi:hypothetical protein